MIGKIISCSSFAGTVGYVMKEQSHILAAEGVTPPEVRDMVRDFKDQTLLNPRIKNAVGHISLSFSPKDADKLTDARMTQIAREYMERMGIRDTQFLLVRHLDQAHPHCHLVYNRVGNNGQTISDKNMKIRNGKVCKELTAKHGLYYAKGKEEVNRDRLREPDKTKYQIYDAIRACLPESKSWGDLENRLQERGITTSYKYCGQTDRKQSVLFGKNGFTFSGSKIDRAFSYTNPNRHFEQLQRMRPPIEQPRYTAQSVDKLRAAADSYRSAFSGLFKSGNVPEESVNLGAFGLKGGLLLPPSDFSGGIAPELMQRRIGESHEEYINRITALIRAATEAMLVAAAERKRKLKERKANKPKIGF
ncbi:relaxase/mobilization nuclease domain-containing protein [Alistipes indistinctus]